MTRREITALLRFMGRMDSRMRRAMADPQQSARTIAEWAEALPHVPAVTEDGAWDAMHAVGRFYEQHRGDRTARFFACEPHHLLAAWAEHRGTRMERHTDPVPAADPDDVAGYRAELLAARRAVATGQAAPQAHQDALNRAGQRQLAGATADIGRAVPEAADAPPPYVPAAARSELRAHLPGARDALPALDIRCPRPACRAARRALCTSPQGKELRRSVHWQRRDAWATDTTTCPECGAGPQQPCSTPEPHPARIRAATTQEGHPA